MHPSLLASRPTPLLGREGSLRLATDLLASADVRLLTVTGPGGTGKTRFALELAVSPGNAIESVCFVDLVPIRDPGLFLPTLAKALRVREAGEEPLLDQIIASIGQEALLLVLDNFEQIRPAAGDVAALLHACPRLKVLVTSRVPLRLRWEHELPLPPLALPDSAAANPHELARVPSVALFVERARAVRPEFALTPQNAETVCEICRRLDGLPLALELAAARIRVLPPTAMLARLARRLDVAADGPLDLPGRQRTLRGAIDWSYDLLDPDLRTCYANLGVFVGSFSMEAAEAVAAASLDDLAALVDASLLQQENPDGIQARFRMLETIREHALERLASEPDPLEARRRHACFYRKLAEEAEPQLTGPDQAQWMRQLELEHENLRAALGWAIDASKEDALQLAAAVWRFWFVRGDFREGFGWLTQVLALPSGIPSARAKALQGAGSMAARRGQNEQASSMFEEALALYQALDDQVGVAHALNNLGNMAYDRADLERAGVLYRQSLELNRELGDRRLVAVVLNNLGNVAHLRGEHADAVRWYERSLEIHRADGRKHGVRAALTNLAQVLNAQADVERAATVAAEALALCVELSDAWGISTSLLVLGEVALTQGQVSKSARLLASVSRVCESAGIAFPPDEQSRFENAVARARTCLEPAVFEAAWQEGLSRSLDQTIADTLVTEPPEPVHEPALASDPREGTAQTSAPDPDPLTRREREVLVLVGRGFSNRKIAEELVISEQTAAVHVKHILAKLDCSSRAQAAVWAAQAGLLADAAA